MGYTKIPAATNKITEFTSSGSWVCPAGVYAVKALLVGGGGGGGGAVTTASTEVGGGGGGGGGAVIQTNLITVPGTTYTITIGAGGSGGVGANIGAVGGDTKFENGGTLLAIAYGGGGGAGLSSTGVLIGATLSRATTGGRAMYNATISDRTAGGGGGNLKDGDFNLSTYALNWQGFKGNNTATSVASSTGLPGLNGYGHGGNGGAYSSAAGVVEPVAVNGGAGGWLTASGSENGTNANANSGGGGGGGAISGTITSVNGGNGGSGYIKLEYFG